MSTRPFNVIHGGRDSEISRADILRIFGDIDYLRMIDIVSLRPTAQDLEQASAWLASNRDVFGSGRPEKPIICRIVDIITDRNVGELRVS